MRLCAQGPQFQQKLKGSTSNRRSIGGSSARYPAGITGSESADDLDAESAGGERVRVPPPTALRVPAARGGAGGERLRRAGGGLGLASCSRECELVAGACVCQIGRAHV